MVKRYKRAAVSEVSGIRLLDGAPVIEGKVINQHKLSCEIMQRGCRDLYSRRYFIQESLV